MHRSSPPIHSVSSCSPNLPAIPEMAMFPDISEDYYLGKPVYISSSSRDCSLVQETPAYGIKEDMFLINNSTNVLVAGHCLPLAMQRGAWKNIDYIDTLSSFLLRLGKCFPFSFPSLLDEDGYISFPSLPEVCITFLPPDLKHYVPITSPSFIPSFLLIFVLLLSAFQSVPFSLTLSLPVALSLCYLEPKATSLTASNDIDLKDKAEDEVCNFFYLNAICM